MSKSLADHIFQDRIILQVESLLLDEKYNSLENRYIFKFKYDKDGFAYLDFKAYAEVRNEAVVGYGYDIDLVDNSKGHNEQIGGAVGGPIKSIVGDIITVSSTVKEDYLHFYIDDSLYFKVHKDNIYSKFKDYLFKDEEDSKPVCPECGGELDEDGNCKNPNCGESEEGNTPSNPNDSPPVILGYASNEIWDIEGRAGYDTPVFFRAYDDYGIYRFSYCEIDEHETEGLQIIRDFKPEKVGDISYRFNIFKELEGNYKYKIIVYDTSRQKAESNIFNVTINPAITKPVEPPTPPKVADSEHIILYDKKANDFTNNGIGILDNDVVDYIVDKEENGIYELTLKYLITGKFVEDLLVTENIIKCKTDISNNTAQLFRVYDSEYIMQENIIIVKASHITYDLKNAFVENVNLIDVTCKQATQSLISKAIGNDKFVVDSNVETRANFSKQRINVLEGIMGIERSIFETFGGDNLVIDRDNFFYNINKKTESDKGIVIAYSKNLIGFKRTVNSNDIITGIYPFAHLRNGAVLRLKEKVIYSQYKDNYAILKIKPVDFTKETVVNEETLRSEANKYFENGCDMPKLNYEVDFISLYSNNLLLKDKFRALEEVILGDTITIQDSKIGINVKARVIRTVYNGLKKRYEKVELGNFRNEYRSSKKSDQNNLKRIIKDIIN